MTILVQQLRDAAREIANWSGSLTDTRVSSQASYMWIVGCIDEDDQKYPVVRIEADAYGHQGESEKLAEFFRLANPKAVLALLDELDTANANHENAVAHLQSVCAERDRLNALLIEREAVRIGQSLQRHDDQKQMDELVALGIQQDKDEIASLREEVAALRDALADKVVDSTKLRSLVPEDGGFTIGVEGGAAGLMAHAFGEQLYTSEAINYLQMTFTSNAYPDLGQIVVTLQRCTGKTPHELRIDAERERDRWQQNYEHLIEQHMPRTGYGCEEGWSRVVEARELQEQLDQLKAENAELKAQAGKAVEPLTLGIRGKAFDPPGTHRAYTYADQPDNQGAWRLGAALVEAHAAPAGDHIDGGLGLLRALQMRGFGVFEMDKAMTKEQQA